MKRIFLLFTSMVLLAIGLSGCAQTNKKDDLVLATVNADEATLSLVTAFNEANDDVNIIIRDYGDQSGVLTNDVAIAIYNDVISGESPDLYIMPSATSWPMDALIAQDSFIDLYSFLNTNSTLSSDDFFLPILEAMERDNALYCFPIGYTLEGIWGLPEYSDGERFPVDCVTEWSALYPEQDMLFGGLTSMDLINMELSQNWDFYINWETRECNFTDEQFLSALNAAYHLPQYEPNDATELITFTSGEYLLSQQQFFLPYTVSDFEAYLMTAVGVEGVFDVLFNPYGGDMVSITLTDSPVVLDVQSSFAISNTCSNPDAAWAFLCGFLEVEYQQSLPTAAAPSLPINKIAFTAETNRLLAEGRGTSADFSSVLALIESANVVISSDMQIELIVYEEVSAYFTDEKTAEDVAHSIQDRVSDYLIAY